MRASIVSTLAGFGLEAMGLGLPQYWEDAPQWIWGCCVWGGFALLALAIWLAIWPYVSTRFKQKKLQPDSTSSKTPAIPGKIITNNITDGDIEVTEGRTIISGNISSGGIVIGKRKDKENKDS